MNEPTLESYSRAKLLPAISQLNRNESKSGLNGRPDCKNDFGNSTHFSNRIGYTTRDQSELQLLCRHGRLDFQCAAIFLSQSFNFSDQCRMHSDQSFCCEGSSHDDEPCAQRV